MSVKASWKSTEHLMALRAELLGIVLVAIGLATGNLWLVLIGAAVVVATFWAYAASRRDVKAASGRPAPVLANPRVG